ncbi:MAG: hypothetical protein NTV17_11915 [Burkholderiales bacterium]|nr:hypothetical protein [Burkholderiales bacterium]
MPLLRAFMILIALGVIGTAALWLVTRERRWMLWSLRLLRIGVVTGLVFFAVLIGERLLS